MSHPQTTRPAQNPGASADLRAARMIDARIDTMPRVGVGPFGGLALVLCMFFANYDITVSGLTVKATAASLDVSVMQMSQPIALNLVGYAIGAFALGHIADRFGRQRGLALTIVVLALSGALSGLAWNIASLSFFRFLAGAGMGAVIALVSTYIGELAPKNMRGRYLATIMTYQAIGQVVIGFVSLPILNHLPSYGWRILLAIGGIVIVVVPMLVDRILPESPRWLVSTGDVERAERIVAVMEARAGSSPEAARAEYEALEAAGTDAEQPASSVIRELFSGELLRRVVLVTGFWFVYYLAVYGFLNYTPLILEGRGVSSSDALLVTVLMRCTSVIVPLLMLVLIERYERKILTIIGTALVAGGLLTLLLPASEVTATAGSMLVNFGISFTILPAYTYTAEVFPTRVRGSASAVGDGVGHLGGAVAPWIVVPALSNLGAVPTIWMLVVTVLFSGAILSFGVRTKNRSLADISSGTPAAETAG
ncbi:MFS transporter [Rhodococcus sp. NPDC004095]